MMRSVVVVLVVLLSFSHGFSVGFSSNVTLANSAQFGFRSTHLEVVNALVYNGVLLESVEVNAALSNASLDFLLATALTALTFPPSTYVSYFTARAAYDPTNPIAGVSVQAAEAFIANTFLAIDEVTEAGTIAQTKSLAGQLYTITDQLLQDGSLSHITFQTSALSTFTFSLTAVFSPVVGVLNVTGSPVITPKSIETVIQISGWPYVSTANSLRLKLGVGTLNTQVQANANVVLTGGSSTNAVFLILNGVAQVDGKTSSVAVSGFTNITSADFGNSDLAAQVTAKYAAAATFKLVYVTFPAGANTITWDPSIGAGATPPSSAAQLGFAFVLSLVIALLF